MHNKAECGIRENREECHWEDMITFEIKRMSNYLKYAKNNTGFIYARTYISKFMNLNYAKEVISLIIQISSRIKTIKYESLLICHRVHNDT